jgi:hypothetical protein
MLLLWAETIPLDIPVAMSFRIALSSLIRAAKEPPARKIDDSLIVESADGLEVYRGAFCGIYIVHCNVYEQVVIVG